MVKVTKVSATQSPQTLTETRKDDHIRINLDEDVDFPNLTTGLEQLRFTHNALPELDIKGINTSVTLFGKTLRTPLLISSMTGGTEKARQLNFCLAEAAQNHNIAMGLGSQRAAIENPDLSDTFKVRHIAPDILLFANLGAIQLNYGYDVDTCKSAVDMIEADGLILHFNVLQEAVQPEGDTNWSGLLNKVEEVCTNLDIPVIAKEVGWGFSAETASQLIDAGVSAIDVAGSGGTSWSQVEYYRAPTAFHAQVALAFADWGIPTAETLQQVQSVNNKRIPVFASGGLRTGIDVAKCIALGATLCGLAGPFLKAADHSPDTLDETIRIIDSQLRVTMLATGSATLQELHNTPLHPTE